MTDGKFRWAYIGCGSIAKNTARSILRGNHEIVSVYSRNFEKAKNFAGKHGACAFDSFEEAVKTADAVYIATPHTSHCEYSVRAIELGKPVLCEKPAGVNTAQVRNAIETAKENNIYFCEAMWTWFSNVAFKVRDWVQNGEIGEIKSVRMNYAFPGLMMSRDSRVLNPDTAGGALLDIGIYPITYCYNLFGNPLSIRCEGTVSNGIDTNETVTLGYDGFDCVLNISLAVLKEGCVITGSKGKIRIPFFHVAPFAFLIKNDGRREVFRGKTDYLTEFTSVADEIKSGRTESEFIPFSSTLKCMEIMDECRRQMGLVYPFEK